MEAGLSQGVTTEKCNGSHAIYLEEDVLKLDSSPFGRTIKLPMEPFMSIKSSLQSIVPGFRSRREYIQSYPVALDNHHLFVCTTVTIRHGSSPVKQDGTIDATNPLVEKHLDGKDGDGSISSTSTSRRGSGGPLEFY